MAEGAAGLKFNRKQFEAKVVGVTFQNEDGSDRQDILKELNEFPFYDDLDFERFEYDGEPAYHVTCEGRIIGNVSAVLASKLAECESNGDLLLVKDLRVYGGPTDSKPDKSYGASIDIEIVPAAELAHTRAESEARVREQQEKLRVERSVNAARKLRVTVIKIAAAIFFAVWLFNALSRAF